MTDSPTLDGAPGAPESDERLCLSRRTFVKTGVLVGGGVAVASQMPAVMRAVDPAASAQSEPMQTSASDSNHYDLADPNNIIYSSCLQCNTGCAIKVKIVDGVASKIDGNPFGPSSFWPYLDCAVARRRRWSQLRRAADAVLDGDRCTLPQRDRHVGWAALRGGQHHHR